MNFLWAIGTSYLMGSFPTAYLIGKMKRIDIRQHGSGNIGTTNAFRVLGKGAGVCVLIIDVMKGILATTLVAEIFQIHTLSSRIFLGLAVVVGHIWTCFLRFKGGKGIAATLGVLLGITIKYVNLLPILLLTILVWGLVFLLSGYVSLSSIIAATCLPFFMAVMNQSVEVVTVSIILCIFVVLRHRSNIRRILSGMEPRAHSLFQKQK